MNERNWTRGRMNEWVSGSSHQRKIAGILSLMAFSIFTEKSIDVIYISRHNIMFPHTFFLSLLSRLHSILPIMCRRNAYKFIDMIEHWQKMQTLMSANRFLDSTMWMARRQCLHTRFSQNNTQILMVAMDIIFWPFSHFVFM